MQRKPASRLNWRDLAEEVVFFAPKFWFPALIAASVFPSLIAYSGPLFSALALWIVGGILLAGLVITLAHGYRLGSTHRFRTIPSLVEAQLGHTLGALCAAASLIGLMIAIAALASTATTFIVVSTGLSPQWRLPIVIACFGVLHLALLQPDAVRRTIPILTVTIFLVTSTILFYGYWQYLSHGVKPSLWELLSGSALARNALTGNYSSAGWQAIAVAALLLVPVSPTVAMFRNEKPGVELSSRMFRVLGGSAAAAFALTVYLSFTVQGFDWTRLDTVIQGPGNLVLLLGVLLHQRAFLVIPVMLLLSAGCLTSAYIYLSSASVLLTELGKHQLLPHQVPVSWRRRGRSTTVVVFLAATLILAIVAHPHMDLISLAWVFFVAISSFLGQVARLKLWRGRFWTGDTFHQRRIARRNILIAILSVGISLGILVVVTLAFNSIWQLLAVGTWLVLGLAMMSFRRSYQQSAQKVAATVLSEKPLTRCLAVALVPNFDASAVKTIRYAWAAHRPRVEVLLVTEGETDAKALREEWERLNISAKLTLVRAPESDHIEPVAAFIEACLETDSETLVSVYLPQHGVTSRFASPLQNVVQRAYARRLARMERVTITWVGL